MRILNERPSLVNARDYGGRTCLHHAVAAGHVSLTNMLLNRGADASIKNNNGHTPIAIAMQNGRDEIVEMLMKTENLGKNPRWPPASAQGGSTAVSSNASAAIAAKPPQPSPRVAYSEQQGNPAAQSTAQQQAAAPQSSAEQVEALYAAGAEKYFEGDYEATEDLYSKALALDPTHLRSLCNYGALMHNVKNNHVQAAALYDRALAVDQNDVVTLYNYALLMEVAKKDFLAAERLYLRALQVDPMHVDTLVNYGSLLKSVHNETATAEKMYVTALQVEPDHIDALCNYALLLRDGICTAPLIHVQSGLALAGQTRSALT